VTGDRSFDQTSCLCLRLIPEVSISLHSIMTTLISWISYSTTGEKPELPRAIYIASDSRITWGSEGFRWDAGRKVFCPKFEPHVFGYCGDVVFPSLVLGQIVTAIDNEVLFNRDVDADQKHEIIFSSIKSSFQEGRNLPVADFSILHAFRIADWPNTDYRFWHISYKSKTHEWVSSNIDLPKETGMIISLGSGAGSTKNHEKRWKESDAGGTSRSYFSAFCDAISSGNDKFSGGIPQLCGLYTKMPPRSIGVIKNNRYFLNGMEIQNGPNLSKIEWRDELFQIIDPVKNSVKEGSRKFVRPLDLTST